MEFPYTFGPSSTTFPSNILRSCDIFFTIEPVLIHYYYLKSTVKIRVHSLDFSFLWVFDKCILACNHRYNIIQNSFNALKIPIHLFFPPALSCTPWTWTSRNHWYFYCLVLPFPESHIVGIIHHVTFSDWFLSLSNKHLAFSTSFCGLIAPLFLSLNNIPSSGWTSLPVHSLTEGHLGCFHVWWLWIKIL